MTSTQPSKLLAALFEQVDEDRHLTVLDTGPAVQETVDFFSHYRCRLHVLDLFSELPLVEEEGGTTLREQFTALFEFPAGTTFDICLFWDLFNYLDRDAILALLGALRPYLRPGSLAHGFAVHSPSAPQDNRKYGISAVDALSVRERARPLPGYAPHTQSKLKNLLYCFNFERSVLLADNRLELLLRSRA